MRRARAAVGWAVCLALVACQKKTPPPPLADAGTDAGSDGGVDLADAGGADAGPAWVALGAPVGTTLASAPGDESAPQLTLDATGAPLLAWVDDSADSGAVASLRVSRWDGTAWVPLGGAVDTDPDLLPGEAPFYLALAVDPAGRPTVAVAAEDVGTGEHFHNHVFRWSVGAWEPLGGAGGTRFTRGISLGFAPDGSPVVAIGSEEAGVLVRQWNGTAWTDLAPALPASEPGVEPAPYPSLALGADGQPLVAYQVNGRVSVARWDGRAWVDLAGPLPGPVPGDGSVAFSPRLKLDADGRPIVAWAQFEKSPAGHYENSQGVPVARFDGTTWASLGEPRAGTGFVVDLALANGRDPVVLFQSDVPVTLDGGGGSVTPRLLLESFDGTRWTRAAPPLGGTARGSLALDATGAPLVAGEDASGLGGSPPVTVHVLSRESVRAAPPRP